MKVALLELCSLTHYEPLVNKAECLLAAGHDVHLFVLSEFSSEVEYLSKKYSNNLKTHLFLPKHTEIDVYLRDMRGYNFDILIINTFLSAKSMWFLDTRAIARRTMLCLQNAHEWCGAISSFQIKPILKKMLIKHFLRQVDCLSVGLQETKGYIENSTNCKIPVIVTPFSVNKSAKMMAVEFPKIEFNKDKINVVIPGTYSIQRRCYLELFEDLKNNRVADFANTCFWLLGGPTTKLHDHSSKVLDGASELIRQGYDIRFFNEFIDTELYRFIMSRADLIFSPIRVEGIKNEVYGVTKDTGCTWDMVRYAKSAILPSKLVIPDGLSAFVVRYVIISDATDYISTMTKESVAEVNKAAEVVMNRNFGADEFAKKLLNDIYSITR
ncbi:hypothetical protein N9K35_04440 [Pseudomonadales bacterium]|nr:hypothetical protein [Pseudomonadales bacterium]